MPEVENIKILPEKDDAQHEHHSKEIIAELNFALAARWILNTLVILAVDALLIWLSMRLGGFTRATLLSSTAMLPSWTSLLALIWCVSALGVNLAPGWGLGPIEELRRCTLLLVACFAVTATALFLGKVSEETSRLTVSFCFIYCVFLIPLGRNLAQHFLIKFKLWGHQTLIYSDIENAKKFIPILKNEASLGYAPVAVLCENANGQSSIDDIPVIENLEALMYKPSIAFVALPEIKAEELVEIMDSKLSNFQRVVFMPEMGMAPSLWITPRDVGGILGLEISHNLLDFWAGFFKRIFDYGFIIATLLLWAPLFSLIYLAIWVFDRHNPLFLQTRIGRNGQAFHMWKFKTMHKNAEALLQETLDDDSLLKTEWENNFKLVNDPRITKMGRWLRKSSLDELPQIINVIKADMSLVGPRPLPTYHHGSLSSTTKKLRQKVRPGITGLWQVSGRSSSGNEGIEKWDTYYVRNWSIWLDIVIIIRTIKTVFHGKGAY